jgi:tetratricopeptide (TPR) repeat protein
MKDNLEAILCHIKDNSAFQDKEYGISADLRKALNTMCFAIQNTNNLVFIKTLKSLISRHPNIPIFKNYLAITYYLRGQNREAFEVNELLLAEHPDYLIAKLNKANEYMDSGDFGKVPELLAPMEHLNVAYPHRETFHVDEIVGYFNTLARYYRGINDEDEATYWSNWLVNLGLDELVNDDGSWYIYLYPNDQEMEEHQEDMKRYISPIVSHPTPAFSNSEPPRFHHQEVEQLSLCGENMPEKLIKELLALPHQTLALDLLLALDDAQKQFDHLLLTEEKEMQCFRVTHALMLLSEINAKEHFDEILQYLKNNTIFLEIWNSPLQLQATWQCIFVLGERRFDLLKEVLLKPGLNMYTKVPIITALQQLAIHTPERKEEVTALFKEVLDRYAKLTPEDNTIDSGLFAQFIKKIVECQLKELLPEIKKLFECQFIPISTSGDYNEVERQLLSPSTTLQKKELRGIFDRS